ncbi:universal stress protein [Robertkochia aurantiaca]|uniref:universal stress protein n=1 Tax=Robertkochia aurantiaca TaxID=2873700 RepID=UPI001CC9CEC3|nr:universal stress protein [Robertkochia sp. 3YJGBD-33]
MKKILLPTDFSETSVNAIRYAFNLFNDTEAEMHLVHAFDVAPSTLGVTREEKLKTHFYEVTEAQAKEEMKKLLDRIKTEFPERKGKIRAFTTPNDLMDAVPNAIKELQADLVLMGTKGATGAQEVFLGSNAVKVMKRLKNIPLLLVPGKATYTELKHIVFFNDLRRHFEKEEVQPMVDLAKLGNAEISLVYLKHVNELTPEQEKNKEELKHLLKEMETRELVMALEDEVNQVITDFTAKENVNLLAMIRNKHGFFEKIFREPVISKVAFHTEVPFLVIPEIP